MHSDASSTSAMNKFCIVTTFILCVALPSIDCIANGRSTHLFYYLNCTESAIFCFIGNTYMSLPEYIPKYAKELHIESIGTVVHSCPFQLRKIAIGGIHHFISMGGVNITNLTIDVSHLNLIINCQ